jgi:hypothetical protein
MSLKALISAFGVHSALVPGLFERPFANDHLKNRMRRTANKL